MSKWNDLVAYYEEHYQVAWARCLQPGDKIFLGDRENRKCRFCGKTRPEVSFRKEAHALPECIGNKSLFTYYEWDTCNQAFGHGCENDFGNWSLPMRTMSRICGKRGIPTIKQGPHDTWRIEGGPTGLSLSVDETEALRRSQQDAEIPPASCAIPPRHGRAGDGQNGLVHHARRRNAKLPTGTELDYAA
jgi:hypothetical protein